MIKTEIAIVAIFVGLCAVLTWTTVEEQKAWEKFAKDHDCKVVERIAGSTRTGTGYVMQNNGKFGFGVFNTFESDKTVYDCNDGVRYVR